MPLGRRFLLAAALLSVVCALAANGVLVLVLGRDLGLDDWLLSLATALVVGAFLALVMLRPRRAAPAEGRSAHEESAGPLRPPAAPQQAGPPTGKEPDEAAFRVEGKP